MNSGGQPTASNAARLLASHSAQSGRNVLLYDTTGQLVKEIKEKPVANNSDLPLVSLGNNITVMTEADGDFFFTSTKFKSTIKDLAERFDQLFICTNTRNAQLGLMALSEFDPGLVVISGLRRTKKIDIKNKKTRQPIDILFYD